MTIPGLLQLWQYTVILSGGDLVAEEQHWPFSADFISHPSTMDPQE
jgi:hypothetical protein